ncbi:MAG: ligase-associated DNA damage response DEXH box helicase [Bacteroidia bacterium]|nr:ligase-associated DNA damage response DEXH box helicase [Bacteroidia bacterium]
MTKGERYLQLWLHELGWELADFQNQAIQEYLQGKSGLVNAPTGSGKTFSLLFPALVSFMNNSSNYKLAKPPGLQIIWITPLKALTKDLQRNMQWACDELQIPWRIGIKTGDMDVEEKKLQRKSLPEVLLITPESLHLLFALKENSRLFETLQLVVVDEWHELLGSKRGVQTELGINRLKNLVSNLKIWGISATIGNLEQALSVLVGPHFPEGKSTIIRSNLSKEILVESVLPDEVEQLPWAGHLGINLLDKVMPLVFNSTTTLLFTNTRSQTEIWYRYIAEKYPELAGLVALHHGSLDKEIRIWVEENLHKEKLKLVICTSSLDLGVDFRPVETVIQVGSPKSISRFIQRAGRSGHRPGETSKIYFVPTHSLELIEAVSLRIGIKTNQLEERIPYVQSFDVLIQYLVTLAVGEGFREHELFNQILQTHAFQYLNRKEWEWMLQFITTGGQSLHAYDEFKKVEIIDGVYRVNDRRIAMRHRLSMGTILSEASMKIQTIGGKYLGTVEEYFISRLKPSDVFAFAGMNLEFIQSRGLTATVRKTNKDKASVPSWLGGRIPLSSQLSSVIRTQVENALNPHNTEPEIIKLKPLMLLQQQRSAIPSNQQLLIEQVQTKEGYHAFVFPFEGRLVHEGMVALLAFRISQIQPISFSMAMNDYGFELLSDTAFNLKELLETYDLFSTNYLLDDIQQSVNSIELAKRKFREIASISGLIFQGFPGRMRTTKHLQTSTALLFDVFLEHEPDNLLFKQAFQEALDQQLEEVRLRNALQRIQKQEFKFTFPEKPSPFAFPIMVDRMRDQLSSEKLDDRIAKMIKQFEENPKTNKPNRQTQKS